MSILRWTATAALGAGLLAATPALAWRDGPGPGYGYGYGPPAYGYHGGPRRYGPRPFFYKPWHNYWKHGRRGPPPGYAYGPRW